MRDNDEWGGIAGVQVVPRVDPLASTAVSIAPGATADTLQLSWPAGLGTIVLEESADLNTWAPTDPQPSENSTTVTLHGPRQFFRVRRPAST